MMGYNIAIIGEQASGKTSCVRLLKKLQIQKQYQRTFGAEVHPIDIIEGGKSSIDVWDMPPENYERYMNKIDGVIYVTKKRTPNIDFVIPYVILDNRHNKMTHEIANNSYRKIVDIITKPQY